MMNQLITRHLMAEATPEEEATLRDWCQASAANEAYYRRRRRVWELLERARRPIARPAPRATDLIARAGIRRFRGIADSEAEPTDPPSKQRPLWIRLAPIALLAASIAGAVLATAPSEPEAAFGAVEFITGPHEVNTLRLADGSVVRMAPGSRLEFENRSPRLRQVSFEGVGYFAVAKDESRPFVIRTQGGDAVVLGTRFELRTQEKEMRVVVVEGRVALESSGGRKEVSTSQMGHVKADQPPTVVDIEGVENFLGWVEGLLVFQATPLDQVARELTKHYGVKIEIHDAELAERKVTAWLQEQSFDAALTAVCGAVGASCTIRPDGAAMRLPVRSRRFAEQYGGRK